MAGVCKEYDSKRDSGLSALICENEGRSRAHRKERQEQTKVEEAPGLM